MAGTPFIRLLVGLRRLFTEPVQSVYPSFKASTQITLRRIGLRF